MAANYPLLFFNGGGKGQAHAQGDLKIFLDTKLSFPGHPKTVFKIIKEYDFFVNLD